jgi:hypothetical protein
MKNNPQGQNPGTKYKHIEAYGKHILEAHL